MKASVVFTLFLFSNLIKAQAVWTGRVMSENKPLSGAVISISDNNAFSNDQGLFVLQTSDTGQSIIKCSLLGYRSLSMPLLLKSGSHQLPDLVLVEDPLYLDQTVISATRSALSSSRAPVLVNTISKNLLIQTRSSNLAEGLSFCPGLRVESSCQNCGYTQVRMNGLPGPYSQILLNSRPVFSALAGVYGLEMIPASRIERIEIVRGGGSVLFGGSAIAGTINVITREPIKNEIELGMRGALIGMSSPDFQIWLNGSIVSKKLDKGLSGFVSVRGREPWDANGDGFSEITKTQLITAGADAFREWLRSRLKLNVWWISEYRRGGNEFSRLPHQADIAEQLEHLIGGANLNYSAKSKNGKLEWNTYASAQTILRNSYYGSGGRVLQAGDSLTASDLTALLAYGRARDLAFVAGSQLKWNAGRIFQLLTGAEWKFNKVRDDMPGYRREITQMIQEAGLFIQAEIHPLPGMEITAGLRQELAFLRGVYKMANRQIQTRRIFAPLVPRIALLYSPLPGLKCRSSYTQAFRNPQTFDEDLHVETAGGTIRMIFPAEDLQSERSHAFTASIHYNLNRAPYSWMLMAESFYTRLTRAFTHINTGKTPNGILLTEKRNGAPLDVYGFNLETGFAWNKSLTIQSGMSFQISKYHDRLRLWEGGISDPPLETSELLRTARTYGYTHINYSLTCGLKIAYSLVVTGRMLVSKLSDPITGKIQLIRTGIFAENNLNISWESKLAAGFTMEISAGVQNLFNSFQRDQDKGILRDAAYVYGPSRPRTLHAGLRFKLGGKSD
jgi:outer membrane receptor for ferrienterochelin and colicins